MDGAARMVVWESGVEFDGLFPLLTFIGLL